MRRAVYRPLESAADLRWLEDKLARSRARFSKLVKGSLSLCAVLIVVAVLNLDASDPGAALVPMMLILGSGIWMSHRAARVIAAHPRLLAAQRELLEQRRAGSGALSGAELRAAVREALEGLRGLAAERASPPPIAAAVEGAENVAREFCDALDRDLVRRALQDLGTANPDPPGSSRDPRVEARRARLEAFRLALANVELGARIDPERFERHAADELEAARRLLQEAPAETLPGPVPAPPAAVEARLAAPRPSVDPAARHLYLKGRFFWNKRTPGDLEKSVELFRDALARDPGYALAHAGLADTFNVLGYYGLLAPGEAFPRARGAAQQALELDPGLAEAHCSLAFTKLLFDWDWRGAESAFLRSFELDPEYATAHHWYAEYLSFQERHDEAIVEARRAVELDPTSRILRTILAWTFFYARRFDEAIAELEEALVLDPSFAPAELWLGLAYEQTGELERGLEILERASADSGHNPMAHAALCRIYAALGKSEASRRLLDRLLEDARERYVPAYHLATLYCAGGERGESLAYLERARQARDNWLVFLRIDPAWDGLRSEPRFGELLHAVGLARIEPGDEPARR